VHLGPGRDGQRMRFLWRFFRRRFFRLWVAIFFRFRFLPEPILPP